MTPDTALSWHYSGAYRDHDLTGCALIVVQKKSPSARRSFVGLLERSAGIEKSAVDQLACQRRFGPTAVHLCSGMPFGLPTETLFILTGIPSRVIASLAAPAELPC